MVQGYAVSTLHTPSQMHYITDFRISVFSGIAAAAAAGSNQDKINTHLAGHFKLAMSLSRCPYMLLLSNYVFPIQPSERKAIRWKLLHPKYNNNKIQNFSDQIRPKVSQPQCSSTQEDMRSRGERRENKKTRQPQQSQGIK